MEHRYIHLFRVTFVLHFFILFFSFTEVISAPAVPQVRNVTDVMRSDRNLCEASKFLYDSEYTKLCASVAYPIVPLNFTKENLNSSLCLVIYDTAYKICQYQNRLKIPLNKAVFNSYIEKLISDENQVQEQEQQQFCDNLQRFTLLYNEIDVLWKPWVTKLNNPVTCLRICFDFNGKVDLLCAVLAWIKSVDDDFKANGIETKYDPVTSDKPPLSQSNDEKVKTMLNEIQKTETEETKKQSTKQINSKDSNIIKKVNSNMPGNVPKVDVNKDTEKIKSITEKPGETQKKINNTSSETQAHKSIPGENKENIIDNKSGTNTEGLKNIPANNDPQEPINNVEGNVPNKNVEENLEESNKKQGNDDLKTSTISENTQDHFENSNEDVEINIEDMYDTFRQPIDPGNQNKNMQEVIEQNNLQYPNIRTEDENQNKNMQEVIEQNNLRYPNIRTEDDSHFFTYFTVITVACIAGYIGYHNKQKRVEGPEVIVVDDGQAQPVTENWIVHLKKPLRRNVMLMLLMSYINTSRVIKIL